MKLRTLTFYLILIFTISAASAQVSPNLEDRLNQKPNTSKVDVIILTQPNTNDRAKNAVRSAKGNVSHDFDIIDGVALTIPKVAAEKLANRDFVREIQPDYKVKTRISESTDTVNAEEVWSQNITGEGVDVAVLDTGIEDNTILNVEEQVDYTDEGTDDLNGHGTHVAGIIASPDEQNRGVAYGANLYDVKVLDQDGTGTASDVIAGLEYAVDNGAEVATLSLGAAVESCDGTSSISEAVDNTVENGVTVTVAAGNNGPDSETITTPGCAEKPITVGSSSNGEISDFSGRGPTADGRVKPDVVAPGEGVTSLTNNDGNGPNFETLSGTSMATPHVAGAAALLLSEKEMAPSEIKNITTYTAEDLGYSDNNQGAGRLNISEAHQEVSREENQSKNNSKNQVPSVEVIGSDVNFLNMSAEAELSVNASDSDNETLTTTFYLEGEQVNQQKGYGEINQVETNLSLNTTYTWSAEVTDGINKTSTEIHEFSTFKEADDREEGETRRPELPPKANEIARKARGGLFKPGSALYGLDLALDRASVAIGLRNKASVVEERAQEALGAAERGNNGGAERALKNLRKTAGNDENSTEDAENALNKVIEKSSEEAKKRLQNTLIRPKRIKRKEMRRLKSADQSRVIQTMKNKRRALKRTKIRIIHEKAMKNRRIFPKKKILRKRKAHR